MTFDFNIQLSIIQLRDEIYDIQLSDNRVSGILKEMTMAFHQKRIMNTSHHRNEGH